MPSKINDHSEQVTISAEQFSMLVTLLMPQYELAKLQLAQMQTPSQIPSWAYDKPNGEDAPHIPSDMRDAPL